MTNTSSTLEQSSATGWEIVRWWEKRRFWVQRERWNRGAGEHSARVDGPAVWRSKRVEDFVEPFALLPGWAGLTMSSLTTVVHARTTSETDYSSQWYSQLSRDSGQSSPMCEPSSRAILSH